MADDRVVVDNVLRFLIAFWLHDSVRQLKSATLDFYSFEDLYQAKQHLLSDIEQWKSDINLPHIPLRRDGEQRSAKSLDDIFLIMTCLDEHLTLKSLPKYVSDSPDSMPSLRIYDGDMKSLMLLFDNLKGRLDALEGAVAAILSNVNSLSTAVQSTVRCAPVVSSAQAQPSTAGAAVNNHGKARTVGLSEIESETVGNSQRNADHLSTNPVRDWANGSLML